MRISVGELQRFFFRAWLFLLVVCLSSACNKYSTSDPNSPISQELAQVKSELTNLRDQLQKQINEINELLNNPNSGLTAEEKEKLTKLRDELQKELDTVNDLIKKVDDLIASGGTVTQEELDAIKKATDDVKSQAEKTLEKTKEYV
ncbi:MAG TPA: hypothetical protein DDY68_00040, partial [Porphyromonadaceae bacterium]|nr:hypothetical protein [Porphyromonadaceae bacterium]